MNMMRGKYIYLMLCPISLFVILETESESETNDSKMFEGTDISRQGSLCFN